MNWKNWPYWLKGALIGIGIFLIVVVFLFILNIIRIEDRVWNCIVAPCPSGFGVYTSFGHLSFLTITNFILLFAIIMLMTFILGAVIGWIVGKIKSK